MTRKWLWLTIGAVAVVAALSGSTAAQQGNDISLTPSTKRKIDAGSPNEPEEPEVSVGNRALKGLDKVEIIVTVIAGRFGVAQDAEDIARIGIKESELKRTLKAALLGSNTVEVIDEGRVGRIEPYIYLNVALLPLDQARETVFSIALELQEAAYVRRPQGRQRVFRARTWQARGYHGIWPDDELASYVKDIIRDLVDQFTIDWHEANPDGIPAED